PFDGGTMKDDDATLSAFAQYLIAFVRAYAQQGIKIEAISPQNEPNYTGTYPTCAWSPATYTKFVGQFLGPPSPARTSARRSCSAHSTAAGRTDPASAA